MPQIHFLTKAFELSRNNESSHILLYLGGRFDLHHSHYFVLFVSSPSPLDGSGCAKPSKFFHNLPPFGKNELEDSILELNLKRSLIHLRMQLTGLINFLEFRHRGFHQRGEVNIHNHRVLRLELVQNELAFRDLSPYFSKASLLKLYLMKANLLACHTIDLFIGVFAQTP